MKFAVVGGGISGCATALVLSNQGHDVTLFETGGKLGGTMEDLVTPHGRYFQNCQYINCNTELAALLADVPTLKTHTFAHTYGSWNNLFGKVMVHHDFAQVMVPGVLPHPPFGALPHTHMEDRLGRYAPAVAEALKAWAVRFGPLEDLDHINCIPLQIGRVFYPDDLANLKATKASNATADALLGVPRSLMEPPAPVQPASLPTFGFNGFFDAMDTTLRQRGVHIHCNAPVKPALTASGQAEWSVRGTPLEAAHVVWCGNPTPVLKALMGVRLDSLPMRCFNLVGNLEGSGPSVPVYYQVFGADHPIMRVYIYKLEGLKISVEGLDIGWTVAELTATAHRVMVDLGWDLRINHPSLHRHVRYTLMTSADKRRFEDFDAEAQCFKDRKSVV